MVKRPRILLITRNLPPLVGGMERLNWHMADELAKQADVKVIGPRGAAALSPKSVILTEAPLKPLPLFLLVSLLWGLWITLRWRPDAILAGSGLTAPIAWLLSKLCGARSAAYLHGFDITVNHGLYRRIWRPTFKKLDHVIVNSTPTQTLAIAADVSWSNITVVHPGVSLPEASQPAESIAAFKEQHGLTGKKILLSVGRLTTRKGLREFVEQALPAIVQAEPDAVLVVIGEAPKNSLAAEIQSVESIQAQAAKSGVSGHIRFLGVITDKNRLATAYEAAYVHVFPVRHIPDDPEGFGMVAVEAAAHGVPTVAFATGGIIDAIGVGESGYLAAPGDYVALTQFILQLLLEPKEFRKKGALSFAMNFSWFAFGTGINCALQPTTSLTCSQNYKS
ncbi:glycosyl transferase [Ectopseudomonas composti]|uniref:Glycosyl transferase n=1 Tax=Ectopseudomonas composti TaxID=658457 RepID=A0ABP3BXQ8_9GAMM|nr:glycosyltransferase family 4 protein [Pseudomonas composti]EZH81605.1 glycosyl transferase [Pseudomonas composti]